MNTRSMVTILTLALVAGATLTGCGSDEDKDLTPNEPIITVTNGWQDEADSTHTFILNSDDTASEPNSSGTFTGSENFPGLSEPDSLYGSWNAGRITFTVQRDVDVTYRGVIDGDGAVRLEFTSPAGDLVLVRDPVIDVRFTWSDVQNGEHIFTFTADSRTSTTFSGEEYDPVGDATFTLSGNWGEGSIGFIVQRPVPVTYTATFLRDDPTRLEFNSLAGPLVLVR